MSAPAGIDVHRDTGSRRLVVPLTERVAARSGAAPQGQRVTRSNRVVRAERQAGQFLAILIGISLVAAAVLALVVVRTATQRAAYETQALRKEILRIAEDNAALELERAFLLRPQVLASFAGKHGLVPPARTLPRADTVAASKGTP